MDKRLKQRLIGATVLAALAVIIVPELVKEPAEQRQPVVTTQMPPRPQEPESPSLTISLPAARPPEPGVPEPESVAEKDSQTPAEPFSLDQPSSPPPKQTAQTETTTQAPPMVSREPPQPLGAAIAPRQPVEPPKYTPSTSRSAESSPPEKPGTDTPEIEPSRSSPKLPEIDLIARSTGAGYTPSAPTTSPESSKVPPQPTSESGWMVQVGSFAVADNAYQLRDRLRSRQFPASVERTVVNGRALHRVYVGPQASRAVSETVLERVRRETGINGQVVFLDN